MNDLVIPEGHGVRCTDCSIGKRASSEPPLYQEGDPRLEQLFKCPKQPGWKRIHKDLAHRCDNVSPPVGMEVRFYPLPAPAARLALEQEAADPGNDRVAASALAKRLVDMSRADAHSQMEDIKKRNPIFGQMVEGLYDEISTSNKRNGINQTGQRQGQRRRF